MTNWEAHPWVRTGSDLSLGERAADAVRDRMGSWTFVLVFTAVMAAWMGLNGHRGFDPYPFILLNLALSTLAALQGAILLIAAKRADQISAELAQRHYDVSQRDLVADQATAALVRHIAYQLGLEGDRHIYLSTSCFHEKHDYCKNAEGQAGPKKPGECKFCTAQCMCPCHRSEMEADDVAS